MEIIKYPDGSSYVKVEELNGNYPTISTFRINTYEDLHHLEQFVDVMNNLGYKPTITIPNLIDAQADRRFAENQSSGLKIVCKRLNAMKANFRIFHPHNAEIVEALIDKVEIIDNSEFISKTINRILSIEHILETNLIALLPDGGAYKWGVKLMDKLGFTGDILAAAKNRKFVDGKSILTQQLPDYDFNGKDIILLDDCLIYGGTFKNLSKLLKERNCGKLYLAVSHMTVQNLGEDPVTDHFDKVFTTNSKYEEYCCEYDIIQSKKIKPKNLEIIKLF